MAHRKNKVFLLVLVPLLVLGLFNAPAIPTSYFITHGNINFDETTSLTGIDKNNKMAINRIFREHGGYGSHPFPAYISLSEYVTSKVGILSTSPLESANCTNNKYCKIEVTTGLICGESCGHGAVYHIEKYNGNWTVRHYSDWVI